MRLRTASFSGFLLAAALVGSACSGSSSVSKADVEKEINTKLTQAVGQAPDSVTCPSDLKGEVGATMRCELAAGGSTIGVTATVTKIDGNTVNFDVKADDSVTSTTMAE